VYHVTVLSRRGSVWQHRPSFALVRRSEAQARWGRGRLGGGTSTLISRLLAGCCTAAREVARAAVVGSVEWCDLPSGSLALPMPEGPAILMRGNPQATRSTPLSCGSL
jgi:hypothetical protein